MFINQDLLVVLLTACINITNIQYMIANGQQNNTKPFAHLPARLPKQDQVCVLERHKF